MDGKKVDNYVWMPESMYDATKGQSPGPFYPFVVIHESGHALGLPDYYDYDVDVGPAGGLGGLDIMDGNWGDHNSFSKFVLDWITPTVYGSGAGTVSLRQSDQYSDAAILMPQAAGGQPFAEYFIVQNRNQSGNDSRHPGKGLTIWHVDARLDGTGRDYTYDNSIASHKLLRLMEADGNETIETTNLPDGGSADSGDYYKSGKTFSHSSTPKSDGYTGSTGLTLNNFSAPGGTMTFSYNFPILCTSAVLSSCTNYTTKSGCTPLQNIDTSGGYPAAHTGFPKSPRANASVYLLKQDGTVVGGPSVTDADGNFLMSINNSSGVFSNPADKFRIVLKIASSDMFGMPCSNEDLQVSFTGSDCAIITGQNFVMPADCSDTRISLPPLPMRGQGRSEVGNVNCDDTIDLTDFLLLKQNFGKNVGAGADDAPSFVDINGDGMVDLSDFLILKQNFSKNISGGSPVFAGGLCEP